MTGQNEKFEDFADNARMAHAEIDRLNENVHEFERAFATAIGQAVSSGREFDEVLRGLARRMAAIAVEGMFEPLANELGASYRASRDGSPAIAPPRAAGGRRLAVAGKSQNQLATFLARFARAGLKNL